MCGIAGWYRRGGRIVSDEILNRQCNSIIHRGPDDDGIFADGDFGFGMRRLSILDIVGGHQPMVSADDRFAIIFNGQIYNHLDVRRDLPDYRFTTRSDTETILAAFVRWGNDAWARLEGMFAVAVWDRMERRLTLARDPLGIKPLYLSEQSGGLSFASELKALLPLPEHRFTVDDRAVHDFFAFGHVRRPRSIYREVRTLDPGHILTIGADGEAKTERYWAPRFQTVPVQAEADWIEQTRAMLVDTTARHMQSDVPVAAFLSGGIDSSAMLASMVRSSNSPITAFTIGHPGAAVDESDAARAIAAHLGCPIIVEPLATDAAADLLPHLPPSFDEPFADMAAVPTWFASQLAARDVKVVLCGDGGDELFAGYKRHRNALAIERGRGTIRALSPVLRAIDALPVTGSARANLLRQHAQRFAEFARLPDGYQQFFAATQISRSAVRGALLEPDFAARHEGKDWLAGLEQEYFPDAANTSLSALEQFLFADLTVNLPSQMLTRLDRPSMAHSLEARVPFLSHKMVDWALTVPTGLKLRGRTGKYLLRKAVAPWLPPGIARLPKQGFQIPMAEWMRGSFGAFAQTAWHDSGAAKLGYLRPDAVDRLFDEHRRGRADHSRMLYAIAVFAWWWASCGASATGTRRNA